MIRAERPSRLPMTRGMLQQELEFRMRSNTTLWRCFLIRIEYEIKCHYHGFARRKVKCEKKGENG
jgi:hypothetical protein